MVLLTICLLFFGLALIGMPLVWSMLVTAVATIWLFGRFYPLEAIFITYVGGVEPLHLSAIPLFIFAGELISRGGVGRRLIDFARLVFGFLPGGLGVVTVASSTLFGAISGSAIADSAAVGSVMIPGMGRRGYPASFSGALVATSGHAGHPDPAIHPAAGVRLRRQRLDRRAVHGRRAARAAVRRRTDGAVRL